MEFGDRIKETATTTGTGTITLAGAVASFRAFSSVYTSPDLVPYAIVHQSATEWEVGIGTMGTGTLARTTVVSSSNADALVNFSAGTKDVFATWPSNIAAGAEKWASATGAEIDSSGDLVLPAQPTPAAPATGYTKLIGRQIAGRMYAGFIGPSGLDSAMQPLLARNMVAFARPLGGATTISTVGMAATATGTATAAAIATTNLHTSVKRLDYLVTTPAATAIAGWRYSVAQMWRGNAAGLGGFTMIQRFGPATGVSSEKRCFVGLSSATAAPTAVNPSTITNMIGAGYDAADSNWQVMHNDGSGTATKIDLGGSFPKPTTNNAHLYEVAIFTAPGGSNDVTVQLTDLVTGATTSQTVSTDLPSNTTLLAPRGWCACDGTTSSVVGFTLVGVYLEADV